jgi:hypothetical protein
VPFGQRRDSSEQYSGYDDEDDAYEQEEAEPEVNNNWNVIRFKVDPNDQIQHLPDQNIYYQMTDNA